MLSIFEIRIPDNIKNLYNIKLIYNNFFYQEICENKHTKI